MRVWDAAKVLITFDDPAADVDVTAYLRVGDLVRSRRVGGPTGAGRFTATLANPTRLFDPPWPGATPGAFGSIRPGQRVQVFYDTAQVFDGYIDDWDHDWPRGGLPTATFEASDPLARLAERKFAEWQTIPGQRVGARLTSALARPEVDWTGATSFDQGAMTLHGDLVPAGTNVLSYIQQLERTDGGRFFATRTGGLAYRQLNLAATPTVVATFTDGASDIDGIQGLVVGYGSEDWYTQVNATRVDGVTQTSSSASVITDLHGGGYRAHNLDNLLMKTDAGAMNLAEYTRSMFEVTTPVITELRCALDTLPVHADALVVAGLEFGDRIAVEWTPTGSGDPADQTLAVEGLRDRFVGERGIREWVRTISTSRLIGLPSWIIGTSQIGTGVLGL